MSPKLKAKSQRLKMLLATGKGHGMDNTVLNAELYSFAFLPQKTKNEYLNCTYGNEVDSAAKLAEDWKAAYENDEVTFGPQRVAFPIHGVSGIGSVTLSPNTRFSGVDAKPWFVKFVNAAEQDCGAGRTDIKFNPKFKFEEFAFIHWRSLLPEVAKASLSEDWGFAADAAGVAVNSKKAVFLKYGILLNYLSTTFCRLKKEGKVCASDSPGFAAFNTGLVNSHYQPLYLCFEPNENQGAKQSWFCKGVTDGSGSLGTRLLASFATLPPRAQYFQDTRDLVFDTTKTFDYKNKHIIMDNLERLPLEFLEDSIGGRSQINELLEKAARPESRWDAYVSLKQCIDDESRLYNRILNRVDDAIDLAKKRVEWNFKTAIPMYYPRKDDMSLLLPLCLVDETKADCALVVERLENGNYIGRTILTMRMAYMDARVICRPESDWLTTEAQLSAADRDDEEK